MSTQATLNLATHLFRTVAGERAIASVRIVNAGSQDGMRKLECLRVGADLLFEGDIIVQATTAMQRVRRLAAVTLGIGVVDAASLWPGGIVPIAAHQSLKDLVGRAIDHWMEHTPLRFPTFQGEESFLSFAPGELNGSQIGRVGGKQIVRIRPDTTVGTVVHEIGHALGLWHEHSRSDRDQHIVIHPENFEPKDAAQFEQPIRNAVDIGPYDLDSIMHYPSDAFSKNGQPTITVRNGQAIGQRNGLSAGDISTMRRLYPTLNWS